ncbi:MAG: response regulator transcription factor [Chloroflexi bacterium]|nr:response regulator transcription factor [Chloroflexota bacterium]
MKNKIHVAILDDHQSIIDGYKYRLEKESSIEVVATAGFGEDLEPMLASHPVDVLLMDIRVPVSASNQNSYPILSVVENLLKNHPNLNILVITMLAESFLIETLVDAGVSGYIYKGDDESIQKLPQIVRAIESGGIYLNDAFYQKLRDEKSKAKHYSLSPRQLEALRLCDIYPDKLSSEIAQELGVANSTLRNMLSDSYFRLDVRTRQAAIAKAKRLGLIPDQPHNI